MQIYSDNRSNSGCLELQVNSRDKGMTAKGYGVSFGGDENVLKLTVVLAA